MQDYFDYYANKKHATFQRWLHRAEKYLPYIRNVFREHGLPEDLIFLPFAESGFNPWAYSRAGAAGLWQFIPGTGRNYGLEVDWWIDERRDPYQATVAAAKHLKDLYEAFGNWNLALAAYNAGEGRVSWAIRKSGHEDFFKLASSRSYLHRETRYYVPKFMAILKIVRNLEDNGFEPLSWDAPVEPTSVQVEGGTDLMALSRTIGLDWKAFRHENPSYRRRASPPGRTTRVYLPSQTLAKAKRFLNSEASRPYAGFRRYRVRRGDSWWRISRRFNIPIRVLKRVNETSSNFLRQGQHILIPGSRSASYAAATTKDGSQTLYRVRQGDSLWQIARGFGLEVQTLRRANNMAPNAVHIRPGQQLRIPVSKQATKRRIAKRRANYTVEKGDTLWELSRRFGVSVKTLLMANGLSDPKRLHSGDRLYIPDLTAEATERSRRQAEAAHERIIYKVKRGDNIWSIARKFGVSTRKVLSWNDLHGGELIHPGDELEIRIK
jgi:membrane-bound lytic murein transglycosylase D